MNTANVTEPACAARSASAAARAAMRTPPRIVAALSAASLLAAAGLPSTLHAQEYPVRPIRMLVPNPPGGVTDVLVRLVAPKMTEALGQPIVIENLPGAGGVPGTNLAAKATPDGHTLVAVFDSFATNPFLYNNVLYDPLKDFVPISLMARQPQVLVVNAKVPVKTVAELVRFAKGSGGMTFAVPGLATSSRFSTELLKTTLGMDITIVPYKGGAAAITDVMGGQVQAMIASIGLVLPQLQGGRLTPIAVSSTKRTPQLPAVPAIAESHPGFEAQSWSGMLAPARTSRAIVERLNGVVVKALAAPDVREKMEALGTELVGSTPAQFGAWLKSETGRWGRIIREQKIVLE